MVLTLAYATLRVGEAARLRRADLDVEAGTLRVANNVVEVGGKLIEGPPKTAAVRRTMTMPASVTDEIEDHLARYAGPTHVLCASQGGLLRPDTWRSLVWRPAVRKAGLRRSGSMTSSTPGWRSWRLQAWTRRRSCGRAGHSSVAFTYNRYGHLLPEVDGAAGAKLDDLRARAISTESGRKVARPAESAEGLPRVQAADLHEPSGRLAREGLGFPHTRCPEGQDRHFSSRPEERVCAGHSARALRVAHARPAQTDPLTARLMARQWHGWQRRGPSVGR